MYGNIQKPKCSANHWVKAKPTNSIFVGYRSNLTKKETKRKKKKKNIEKKQEEKRKRVRGTTRDATQARSPIQIPTAVLLRQTGSTAAGIREK